MRARACVCMSPCACSRAPGRKRRTPRPMQVDAKWLASVRELPSPLSDLISQPGSDADEVVSVSAASSTLRQQDHCAGGCAAPTAPACTMLWRAMPPDPWPEAAGLARFAGSHATAALIWRLDTATQHSALPSPPGCC